MKPSGVKSLPQKLNKLIADAIYNQVPVFDSADCSDDTNTIYLSATDDQPGRQSFIIVVDRATQVVYFELACEGDFYSSQEDYTPRGGVPDGELPNAENYFGRIMMLYGNYRNALAKKQFSPDIGLLHNCAFDLGLRNAIIDFTADSNSRNITLEAKDPLDKNRLFVFDINSYMNGGASLSVFPAGSRRLVKGPRKGLMNKPYLYQHQIRDITGWDEPTFADQHITARVAARALALLIAMYREDREIEIQANKTK